MKKLLKGILLMGIVTLVGTTGCSSANSIEHKMPKIKAEFKTTLYESDKLAVKVPAGWTVDDKSDPLLMMKVVDESKKEEGFTPTISIGGWTSASNLPDIKAFVEQVKESQEGNDPVRALTVVEVKELEFGEVAYFETVSEYTEEGIDTLLANGVFTEEGLAQMGGREALLEREAIKQIEIHLVKAPVAVVIRGEFNDETYEIVKERAIHMAETLTIK